MIQQIAVFLENKEGQISKCCKALKEAHINLRSMSIADTKEFGILRVITDDSEKALSVLQSAGFLANLVNLVAVEVEDKSGALSNVLIALSDRGVNIEYMYSYASENGVAKIVFKTATPEKALEVLNSIGATVI